MSYIPLAKFGRRIRNLDIFVISFDGFIRKIRQSYIFPEYGRDFARNSQNTLAVGSVSGNSYIENIIVESEQRFYVRAVFRIGGQYKQSAIIASVEHIAVDAELGTGTEHTV